MRRNGRAFALAVLGLFLAACGRGPNASAPVPPPEAPPLIARSALFGDAARGEARLSPQGEMIAFLAPRSGAPNIWVVATAALGPARAVTDERALRGYVWAEDGRHLLYLTDDDGDDQHRLMVIDSVSGERRALTEGAHAEIVGVSHADPGAVIVALNERSRAWADLYRIDVTTGSRTLIERNTRSFFRYVLDRDNRVRLGLRLTQAGALEVWRRDAEGAWSRFFEAPPGDAFSTMPIGFAADGRSFFMYDSTRERAALVRVDAETGVRAVLGESERADVVDVLRDPVSGEPDAFAIDYLRREWRALDADAQADLSFLDAQLEGDPNVTSRSLDDRYWIVVEDGPRTPPRSYLYNRADPAARTLTLLFRNRPALEGAPLQQMIPVEVQARDGLTLVSYLTLPIGADGDGDARPDTPTPLVLLVHDGPWARDSLGFNAYHQWLANRGYAVLSVNYRGSTGFGKAFLNAGNREWGGKMQEDLLDAVAWAIEEGIAAPEQIAIFGAGFGGYAALAGLAFTPEQFACGIDVAGPSNLEAFVNNAPARDEWRRPALYARIGDPRTPPGVAALAARSPLTRATAIERPLLMAHGARDQRVMRADSDLVSIAPRARRAGLVYLLYPETGDVLARAPSRLSFMAVADQFLARCLGGRAELMNEDSFAGVRVQTLAGASRIEGLARFAPPPPAPPAAEAGPSEDEAAFAPAPVLEAPIATNRDD